MRCFVRAMLVVGFVAALAGVAGAQAPTKRDTQGPVTVAVTPIEGPKAGAPLRVRVALDTHSVGLDGVVFERSVILRGPDGAETSPSGVEQVKGGGHHREATLVFPSRPQGELHVVVKDVGGVAERSFRWEGPR